MNTPPGVGTPAPALPAPSPAGKAPALAGPLARAWGTSASPSGLEELLPGGLSGLRIRPLGDPAWLDVGEAAFAGSAAQARVERGTAWPQPLVSHYARYFRDGNRTAYEGLVGARQQRLTRAVVMALLAGRDGGMVPGCDAAGLPPRHAGSVTPAAAGAESPDWLDEVIDGVYLLCEQSSWSWAAHDDVFSRSGEVVPDRSRPYLDLGAGEVAAQLAWTDYVLGDSLEARAPGLRRRIRQETAERAIAPFLERLDWHWLGLDGDVHNWNPWIHTNLIAAALFLVDSPQLKAATVARCVEGLDRFLASIPADGAIDEGFAYWWNGAGRALEGLALLEEATGGALDVALPVVRQLVAFPHRMHLGGIWFLNVADGPARAASGLPWDMLHRWAVRLDDSDAARHAASFVSGQPEATAGLGRVLHSLLRGTEERGTEERGTEERGTEERGTEARGTEERRTEEGGADEPGGLAPLVPFTYLPSVQIMVARETAGTAQGLLLAAKGGHNGEHHNHRDVGSVVVAVDGVPLLVDAGQPTYTAKTFGPNRYDIRAMQSAWHSVPAPFGLEQGTGKDFAAEVLQAPTPDDPTLRLALGAAYGLRKEQWIRTSSLDRKARRVIVTDSWDLPDTPDTATPDVDITYLTAGTVSVGRDGSATILPTGISSAAAPSADVPPSDIPSAGRGRGAVLRWEPAAAVVLVDEWPLDDPLLSDVWGARLTRLRFRLPQQPLPEKPGAPGAFTLTVEATP